MAKQCEIGVPSHLIRAATADWRKQTRQKPSARMAALPGGYVSKLPAPPASGSADYYRCISKWYAAYMQASMMDQWLQQIAMLSGQIASGEPILDALVGAYQDCMEGTPV